MSNINAGDMVLIVAGAGVGRSGIVEGCIPPGESERIYAHDRSYDVTATNTGDSPVFVVSAPGFSTTFKNGENLRGFLIKERKEIMRTYLYRRTFPRSGPSFTGVEKEKPYRFNPW